jgi:hypothetical protein
MTCLLFERDFKMRNYIKPHKEHSGNRGSSIFATLVIASIFISITIVLLNSTSVNKMTVTHNVDQFMANQAAILGMQISVDMINEAFYDPNSPLDPNTTGNIEGIARSRSDPFVPNTANSVISKRVGAIEHTIQEFREIPFTGIMPTDEELLPQASGYFIVQAERINDSWVLRIRGKQKKTIRRIKTIITPIPGRPFTIGVYGTSAVIVDGPGTIDWINSADQNDIETPVVLESGGDITVVKDPIK